MKPNHLPFFFGTLKKQHVFLNVFGFAFRSCANTFENFEKAILGLRCFSFLLNLVYAPKFSRKQLL